MLKQGEEFDFLVIGGGLFGSYAALYLAGQGRKVLLIEKEKQLFTKASIVNQARLHGGYHYPRSVATAKMSDENKARFTRDHEAFINFEFDKYYGIDQYNSLTDAAQFERFCQFIDIKCERVQKHPFINLRRLEALFLTKEYSFDPLLIANYYKRRLYSAAGLSLNLNTIIESANAASDHWEVILKNQQKKIKIKVAQVINASYAASNSINQIFDQAFLDLMHEISEMVLLTAPDLKNMGLTVMDGPFASLMPYGKSGLLSLSSVVYTHHKVSYEGIPQFECQERNPRCKPNFLENCNFCPAQPISNKNKMLSQIKNYFNEKVEMHYFQSLFTIKSKLRANYIDDGRPTEISCLQDKPAFYCIFAGKINSIYEIEKVIK